MMPTFSIILPISCNNNKHQCILNAIHSILNQTYQKFELIVICYGLTEIKIDIDQLFNFCILEGKIKCKTVNCKNIYEAFNEGLALAKNEWIIYADLNNRVQKYFLGVFAKNIIDHPECKIYYTQYQYINGKKIDWHNHEFLLEKLKQDNFINLYAYAHHKSLISELGAFNDKLHNNIEQSFLLNQCSSYKPYYISLFTINVNDNKIISNETTVIDDKILCQTYLSSDSINIKQTNKIVCYTCITNDYDFLRMPHVIPKNIDFVCFSDKMHDFKNGWIIRKIPDELKTLSNIKQQRLIKILSHKWLPEYETSIWIDGNISILKDLNCLLDKCNLDDSDFYTRKHPIRNCIYDEASECIKKNKDNVDIITNQINRYKAEGYPRLNGLIESGILIRKNMSQNCIKIENYWAIEVLNDSYRDQLSFNYVIWKHNLNYKIIDVLPKIDSQHIFKLTAHQNKNEKHDNLPITIVLCNYNTNELTNACIQSIIKNSKLNIHQIIVLDNSDQSKLQLNQFNMQYNSIIKILNNNNGELIDFNEIVKKYGGFSENHHASMKHAYSIQYLIDQCQTPGMLLCDSDIIIKKAIDFIDYDFLTIGQIQRQYNVCRYGKTYLRKTRIYPMLQFFNVSMFKYFNLKYFDGNQRIIGCTDYKSCSYDTGASFFEDMQKINKTGIFKEIDIFKLYINHLCGASWSKIHDEQHFLRNNKKYI